MSDAELGLVPAEYLYDYAGVCWWCGGVADSREHKWKKSEIVNLFGDGQFDEPLVWIHDDKMENLRGPKASGFMFSRSLCIDCNGARSQPFDEAYARWSEYLVANHARILEQRWVNFAEVYGNDLSEELPKLARYYGKHIGCRVAEHAGRVPDDLRDFLDGKTQNLASVYSELGVREMLRVMIGELGPEAIGLNLRESAVRYSDASRSLTSFKSGVGIGAFEFLYDVNLDPGRPNTGNGVLTQPVQRLWTHDEDLFDHLFGQ